MTYKLKLFVAGDTDLSRRATANLERVCSAIGDNCETEVIDIFDSPDEASQYRIIATPVVIRSDVDPPLKALGDLSNERRLISALNLTIPSA